MEIRHENGRDVIYDDNGCVSGYIETSTSFGSSDKKIYYDSDGKEVGEIVEHTSWAGNKTTEIQKDNSTIYQIEHYDSTFLKGAIDIIKDKDGKEIGEIRHPDNKQFYVSDFRNKNKNNQNESKPQEKSIDSSTDYSTSDNYSNSNSSTPLIKKSLTPSISQSTNQDINNSQTSITEGDLAIGCLGMFVLGVVSIVSLISSCVNEVIDSASRLNLEEKIVQTYQLIIKPQPVPEIKLQVKKETTSSVERLTKESNHGSGGGVIPYAGGGVGLYSKEISNENSLKKELIIEPSGEDCVEKQIDLDNLGRHSTSEDKNPNYVEKQIDSDKINYHNLQEKEVYSNREVNVSGNYQEPEEVVYSNREIKEKNIPLAVETRTNNRVTESRQEYSSRETLEDKFVSNLVITYNSGKQFKIKKDNYPELYEKLDLNGDGKISYFELYKANGLFNQITLRNREGDIKSIVKDFIKNY